MGFDWFGAKTLGKAATQGDTPGPQGNQDAGLDMGKLAQQSADLKRKQMQPAKPLAPVKPKKKTVAQSLTSNLMDSDSDYA